MPIGFDARRAVMQSRRHLPHLRQEGVVYFVTFRMADSVPQERLREWREEQEARRRHAAPGDEDINRVQRQIELWLDRGLGDCTLENPGAPAIVEETMRHFDRKRYFLDEFVVMPNHVHALLEPLKGYELSEILRSWKLHSAREINRLLGRSGALWQSESFDHIVRDMQSLERFRRYIRRNPAALRGRLSLVGRGSFQDRPGI